MLFPPVTATIEVCSSVIHNFLFFCLYMVDLSFTSQACAKYKSFVNFAFPSSEPEKSLLRSSQFRDVTHIQNTPETVIY